MAKRRDIDAHMEPSDAQRLQRVLNAIDVDAHMEQIALESRARKLEARMEKLDALVSKAKSLEARRAGAFGTHFKLAVELNDPGMTADATPGVRASLKDAVAADRERRITEVHAAVAELDTEWLEYSLDTHAWFLSKPQLRNDNDPVIAAFRHAQAELRDLAADLTSMSTDAQIAAAQQAARRALAAWGEANTHALQIGVSDLSPSEETALKLLHRLVNTFNDRATSREMWAELRARIIRTMDKLTVTSFDLNVIADLPVIAAESRLRALPAAPDGA